MAIGKILGVDATTFPAITLSGTVSGGGQKLDNMQYLELDEISTPSALADHGKIYIKSIDRCFFQDGAGDEHELVEVDVEHGEMYMDTNSTATTITDANKAVAIEGFSSSHLQDISFVASKNGVITDTENNGSGKLRITDATHGLTTGDIVTINGLATPAQNATTAITEVTVNVFDCDNINWVTDDETGTWQMGSYLLISTGGVGTYLASMSSSATPAGANKTYLIQLCIDTTAQVDVKVERKFSATDIGSLSMTGFISVVATNRVWISVTGLTDGTDVTFKHINLLIHRI